jgi:hypothetical protein
VVKKNAKVLIQRNMASVGSLFDHYTLLAQNLYETNDWLRMYIIFVTYVFLLVRLLRKTELPHSLLKNLVVISTFAKLALVSRTKLVSRSRTTVYIR